jgi:putative lipoic acid-binding regulatory protein
MGAFPSIELLEAHHTFPGQFMFKAIGRTENGFVARTVAAVRDELAEPVDPPYSVRETGSGHYVAVTLEVRVQTATQVVAVYQRMSRLAGLKLLL